jgi:ATP adenylyltransferase
VRCDFCDELEAQLCPFLTPPRNRFLYETRDFMVFPTLGSFVEGYLLVCPKAHVASVASLGLEALGQLERVTTFVKDVVQSVYGRPIVFEHGMSGCGRIDAGGCIEHAHLHVVPGDIDIGSLLREYAPAREVAWEELGQWRGRSYLLGQSHCDRTLICEVPDVLPSQYLRRLVARTLGVLDFWDWRDHLGIKEIESTMTQLGPAFRSAGPQGTLDLLR